MMSKFHSLVTRTTALLLFLIIGMLYVIGAMLTWDQGPTHAYFEDIHTRATLLFVVTALVILLEIKIRNYG